MTLTVKTPDNSKIITFRDDGYYFTGPIKWASCIFFNFEDNNKSVTETIENIRVTHGLHIESELAYIHHGHIRSRHVTADEIDNIWSKKKKEDPQGYARLNNSFDTYSLLAGFLATGLEIAFEKTDTSGKHISEEMYDRYAVKLENEINAGMLERFGEHVTSMTEKKDVPYLYSFGDIVFNLQKVLELHQAKAQPTLRVLRPE